jgi:hypothetical protein
MDGAYGIVIECSVLIIISIMFAEVTINLNKIGRKAAGEVQLSFKAIDYCEVSQWAPLQPTQN